MRVIPLDLEISVINRIYRISILNFDWGWNEFSLFEIGWWQDHLLWDFLGLGFLYRWWRYGRD